MFDPAEEARVGGVADRMRPFAGESPSPERSSLLACEDAGSLRNDATDGGLTMKSTHNQAARRWLLALLAVAAAVFIAIMPAGQRLRAAVAFAIVTPLAVVCLGYVLRDK